MNRKSLTIAATTATAVSSAILVAKKVKNNKKDEKINTYRNTELGKYDKNDKGIYYTNGNYEAFARPKKPEGVENKNAYLIGSGLASLAAACFLVRDGQMPGKNIHILEAMDNLWFIGDVRPEISVETVVVNEIEVDVLTVYDTQKTPIYLKRNYGEMLAGCIYMRNGDKNTPNRGMASIDDVEKLWKKRFGLLQTPLEYIIGRLQYQTEWKQQDHIYYNMYRPEYQLKILKGGEDYLIPEFYAYTMSIKSTSYEMLQIIAGDTILEEYQIVVLDSGRYKTPVPEWGFAGYDRYRIDHKFTYKYFVKGSTEYRLQQFFLDGENEEAIYANRRLMEVVLLYETEDEKSAFEAYIEDNQEEIMERISKKDRYSYIQATNELDTKECI